MSCQSAVAMQERGFAVRGTFIDGPAEWFDLIGARTRAHSAPSASRFDNEECRFSMQSKASPRGRKVLLSAGKGAEKRDNSPSAQSDASTGYQSPSQCSETEEFLQSDDQCSPCSDVDIAEDPWQRSESDLWWLDAESARACKDRARDLIALVEQECAFLRLNGHSIRARDNDRARRQGLVLNVRFFVRGLPSAKRAKWQHPLCWAAAGVLQRAGMQAKVHAGEVHVPVQKDVFIRLEFVSGRL